MIDFENKDRINNLVELAQRQEQERLEFMALTKYSLEDFLKLYKMGKAKIQVSQATPVTPQNICPHNGHNCQIAGLVGQDVVCSKCNKNFKINKED